MNKNKSHVVCRYIPCNLNLGHLIKLPNQNGLLSELSHFSEPSRILNFSIPTAVTFRNSVKKNLFLDRRHTSGSRRARSQITFSLSLSHTKARRIDPPGVSRKASLSHTRPRNSLPICVSSMCWIKCPRLLNVSPQELNLQTFSMNTAISVLSVLYTRASSRQGRSQGYIISVARRAEQTRNSRGEYAATTRVKRANDYLCYI